MNVILIVLLVCGLFAKAKAELCSANVTMYDLPGGVIRSAIAMATIGKIEEFTGCHGNFPVDQNKIGFWLYKKENHDTPIRLNQDDPKEINPSQKIIFITHGWTCNITGNGFPEMKDAYLKRYPDVNIILIEWTTYAVDYYANSYCYIPKIGEIFGKFICNLNLKYNVDISQLHLIGHSMGGQISGLTGQETLKQCSKKIGRITALDPAGPIYQAVSKSERLDASDADMVDVIHTNQEQFGYHGSCGTVDFYPNCGYFQPKCVHFTRETNILEFMDLPFLTFACSHQRSIEYFVESINSDAFSAKSCKECPGIPPDGCFEDLFKQSSATMGEDYDKDRGTAISYYLKTNAEVPFAKRA